MSLLGLESIYTVKYGLIPPLVLIRIQYALTFQLFVMNKRQSAKKNRLKHLMKVEENHVFYGNKVDNRAKYIDLLYCQQSMKFPLVTSWRPIVLFSYMCRIL